MKNNLLLFLILFLPLLVSAQAPFFKVHTLGEEWKNIKVDLMYEDSKSFLWFGTSEGLFKYDGLGFQRYSKGDSLDNCVTAIFEDSRQMLWVGYRDGSIYTLPRTMELEEWMPEEGVPNAPVKGFAEDGQGNFWFATYGEGVYYQRNNRLYNIDERDGLLGNDVYVMTKDADGRMWLGTDNGISICKVRDGQKVIENITVADGLPDDIVKEIIRDQEGNMWIGMHENGFCAFLHKENRFSYECRSWEYGAITNLEVFEDKELWIGTDGNSLFRYDFQTKEIREIQRNKNLVGAKIYDIHKDLEGNIWVLSNSQSICSANRQFEFIEEKIQQIQALHTDKHNKLWVGTSKGLFSLEKDKMGQTFFQRHLKEQDLNIVSLFEDEFQVIWIGTFGEGVYCFDPVSGAVRHLTEKSGLINGSILSIDGQGNRIWLASLGGAMEYTYRDNILNTETPVFHNFNQESGLGTNFIYKVFIDSEGRTWFGTDGKGLSLLKDGQIKNYAYAIGVHEGHTHSDSVPLKAVYSITEDRQGHIWVSTAKQGIFEYDGENFHHLTLKEGMRDMVITSLITDKNGNILIVHPSGIDILDPVTRHLIYYDEGVGITDANPNLNTVCSDLYGNIWIGNQNDLIQYSPLTERLSIHPRTQLYEVSIFYKPISFWENNTFSYHENNLVFNYVGLWYTDSEVVKYRYKLEGFDIDWRASKDRQAVYPTLPPGKYNFQVTSTENDAFDDEPVVSYSFEILQPVWQRWWFILLSTLAGMALVYAYIKARDRRLHRINLLEKEKIESQFEALKSQINPHFLFNSFNTLITLIDENPKLAVQYVEKFSDFYRHILQYREKSVIALQEEIDLITNYGYLLKKRFGKNLDLQIDLNGEPAYVAPLTLQMLVENAVKHNVISKSRPLVIKIEREGADYLTVTNNLQMKLTPQSSTGFGLQSIVKRYALLTDKSVKVEEQVGFFKVSIPLIK